MLRASATRGKKPCSALVRNTFAVGQEAEDESDRRMRTVTVTEKGRGLFVPMFRQLEGLVKKVFQDVSPEEQKQFEATLEFGCRYRAMAFIGFQRPRVAQHLTPQAPTPLIRLPEFMSAYGWRTGLDKFAPDNA